jgi:glycerol-1-phosphate dehydrogenase [NAD(P)+]
MSADRIKVLKQKGTEKSRWMQLPRDIVIGHEVLTHLPAVCSDLRLGRSALVITGTRTRDLAGEQVIALLGEHYEVTSFVAGTISMEVIRQAEEVAGGISSSGSGEAG